MRNIILTAAFVLAGHAAMASSIETISGAPRLGSESSIINETCDHCVAVVEIKKKSYVVPTLAAGTQTMSVEEINGQRKVVRTEAWMGGSPVVFITNATPIALAAAGAPPEDLDTTATAAVTPVAAPAPTPAPPVADPLNIPGLVLRPQQ